MSDSEKFAVAAHLHVLIRRKLGRVTDTEWMVLNVEYAREILRIARAEDDVDLQKLADRFEGLINGLTPKQREAAKKPVAEKAAPPALPTPEISEEDALGPPTTSKYIYSLR